MIWVSCFILIATICLPLVAAQAPNTDFAAWPSGLLTLVTSLYIGTTLSTSALEVNDPIASFRSLGLLNLFSRYSRGHDHLGMIQEVWIEPTRNSRTWRSLWSGKTAWQDEVHYSALVARVRGDAAHPVVSVLRGWATDPEASVERVQRSARERVQRSEDTPVCTSTEILPPSVAAVQAGNQLAESFQTRLAGYTPLAEEYSLICQGLTHYSSCAHWLSIENHSRESEAKDILGDAGLSDLIDGIGPPEPWFTGDESACNDTVRALYVALNIRNSYRASQTTIWSSSSNSDAEDVEKGVKYIGSTFEDLVEAITSRSSELVFTWRPLNFAGGNRSVSLLSYIWGVRHFGSANLQNANPSELAVLSLLSGIGMVYKSVGFHFPSPKTPTSPDHLANHILSFVEEPIEETWSWIGVLPVTQVLYHGRLTVLLVVVSFFVSLGSGAAAWMCLGLCLCVVPRDDPIEAPELRGQSTPFPWPPHTVSGVTQPCKGMWMLGMEFHKPYIGKYAAPSLYIILLGFGSTLLAHSQQMAWRPALNFPPLVHPAGWIQWTSIGLSIIMGIVQCIWYLFRANGHGPASRGEGLLATRLAIILGTCTTVICVLRVAGVLGPYARWIAEATLCTTTLPVFILYPDGPAGDREGGCRILYMWQWLLAGTVSLIR